jgi:PAS domain S-box-containing protein
MFTSSPTGTTNEEVQFPLESSPSLLWITRNHQPRVFEDLHLEMAFEQEHLSGAKTGAGFPLVIQSKLKAILFVYTNREEGIPPSLISALELFSSVFSTILDNTEKSKQLQGGKETTTSLKQISQDILLAKNEAEVIKFLLSGLASSSLLTGIYSVEKDHLSVLGINDPNAPRVKSSFEGIALPLHGIAEKLPQDDVFFIEDLSENLQFRNLASFYSRNEYQSAAMFTIYEIGKLSKIIVISSQAPNKLTREDVLVFDELIKSTRRSLSQFKEIKHLNQQLDELTTLQKVSAAVSAETDLESLYQVLHQQIMDAIGSDVGFLVATLDADNQMIQVPYLYEDGKLQQVSPFLLGEGITSLLIKNKKPIMVNENARQKFDEMGAKYLGEPSKSWLGVPLLIQNEAIGALIVQDMHKERRFSDNDLNVLTTIAPHVALALRNAQTFTRMQTAMTALDQESYLLNALLSNVPEQVYFLNKQGNITRASQSFATQLGISDPAELVGKSILDSLFEETTSINTSLDSQVLESREAVFGLVEQSTDKQGKTHWYLSSRIPLIGQNQNLNGLLGLSQNINEMKEAEQLAQERAQRLEIASEIASEASSTLSADEILNKAVNLIRDKFGYYHASVFLIDPLGEYAVLREAAGEIGAEMLKIGHKLAIGSKSLVGQATGQGMPVVSGDVTRDPNYYPNPLLPETRAEMVVPVKLGNRIIGALDVQSKDVNAFPPEVVDIMQILADQLAIATSNAQLFASTQETLNKTRALNKVSTLAASSASTEEALQLTVTGLKPLLKNADIAIFLVNAKQQLEFRTAAGFKNINFAEEKFTREDGPLAESLISLDPILLRTGETTATISSRSRSAMLIPFQFSGEPLGLLCIESEEIAAFDQNDFELMLNFGNMLASIIFNNRLLTQVRRQAERQQVLFDITNKVRQTVDMQSILQTSVSEICRAVGAQRARIEISPALETTPEQLTLGEASQEASA